MAHFAQIDKNNVVTRVIVINNAVLIDSTPVVINNVIYVNGESEARGVEFCRTLHGADTNWVQTSYNNTFRGLYAGVGYTYDAENDVFVAPESVLVVETFSPLEEPVVESAPVTTIVEESVPVVEAPQEIVSQAQVDLTSTALPAFTSSDVAALTSEQITGL